MSESAVAFLPVAENHALKAVSHSRHEAANTRYQVSWYEERDDDGVLVARYRTWYNHGLRPPYRRQLGWERYSPEGSLTEREVRYAQRDSDEWLH